MLIDFGEGHSTVIGITRSGKTFATKKSLANEKVGTLFFNTQYEKMPNTFITVSGNDNIKVILKALISGRKINYIPQLESETRGKELINLVNALYSRGSEKKMYFVVDEVHLYEKEPLKKLIQIATTGLRFGINGIWISQRPANIDNTLMTQSNQFIIFRTNMESGYFDRYGIPGDIIKEKLKQGGEYSYCVYDLDSEVKGAYRV